MSTDNQDADRKSLATLLRIRQRVLPQEVRDRRHQLVFLRWPTKDIRAHPPRVDLRGLGQLQVVHHGLQNAVTDQAAGHAFFEVTVHRRLGEHERLGSIACIEHWRSK